MHTVASSSEDGSSSSTEPADDGEGLLGAKLSGLSLEEERAVPLSSLPPRLFLVQRATEVGTASAEALEGSKQEEEEGEEEDPWAGVGGLGGAIQEVLGCVAQASTQRLRIEAPIAWVWVWVCLFDQQTS